MGKKATPVVAAAFATGRPARVSTAWADATQAYREAARKVLEDHLQPCRPESSPHGAFRIFGRLTGHPRLREHSMVLREPGCRRSGLHGYCLCASCLPSRRSR